MVVESKKRKYERIGAEAMEDTRRRITEAAVDLHGSVGPARTTISAVAERAGSSGTPSTGTSPPKRTCTRPAPGIGPQRIRSRTRPPGRRSPIRGHGWPRRSTSSTAGMRRPSR